MRTDLELEDGYRIGSALNGGYLLMRLAAALRREVPDLPDPLAVSAHYASAGLPGAAEVVSRVVRRGRSSAVLAADLCQGDEVRLSALATYGDLSRLPDDVATTATPPDLPPVEECAAVTATAPDFARHAPFVRQFELRTASDTAGWLSDRPSGQGVQQGWFRPLDGREPDVLDLLLVLDCLPPVTFDLGMPGWAPTLELTAHLRARPAPGWLRVRHATRNLAGGMFEEDCEVWDSADRLVAQGRQLARVPRR